MHCDGPHEQYVSFLNTVCHDAYQLFAYMEMCQVVQALVFCFALGFAVNVWKHRNDTYGDDDEATRPLLGSASSIQRGRERDTPISDEPFRFSKPMRGATDLYQDKTPSPVCGVCQDRYVCVYVCICVCVCVCVYLFVCFSVFCYFFFIYCLCATLPSKHVVFFFFQPHLDYLETVQPHNLPAVQPTGQFTTICLFLLL